MTTSTTAPTSTAPSIDSLDVTLNSSNSSAKQRSVSPAKPASPGKYKGEEIATNDVHRVVEGDEEEEDEEEDEDDDEEEVPPVLDLSQSPQVLWAPGRSSVHHPPRKRARLQGPTGLTSSTRSSTSFSAPATPKADLSSSFIMSPTQHAKQRIHCQSELQGNGTGPSSQSAPVLNFEQASGLPPEYESG
ncbi:hypothetical protein EDB86DRAFT_1065583 [Lactarius hatsudake]|nr:hypothetical protein EDB86DRAFT_1065583 [Lactarius hatsudake]